MSLSLWDPFFFNDSRMVPHVRSGDTLTKPFAPLLSTDLIESETDFHVSCDLPGVNKEDLDITLNDGYVTVKAERRESHDVNNDKVHRSERSYGSVQRTIAIPKNADASSAEAKLENGVLSIRFPKKEVSPEGRKLQVA